MGDADARDVDIRRLRKDIDTLVANQNYGLEGRQSDNYAKLGLKYDIKAPRRIFNPAESDPAYRGSLS